MWLSTGEKLYFLGLPKSRGIIEAQHCAQLAYDDFSMSKDPVSPENLANLRRTLPGLGIGDGQPVPLQEVSPSEIQSVLGTTEELRLPDGASSPAVFPLTEGMQRTSNPAMPMMRSTSNPAMPMMRSTSNPAMPMMRSTSNPAMPMMRGASNPALLPLRTTGSSDPSLARSPSGPSVPSHPPTSNRLPLLIVGLGSLALAIGVVAWLHPGQPTVPSQPERARVVSAPSQPSPIREDGQQVAVPVRTVTPVNAPVVVTATVDKPSPVETPPRSVVRKPVDSGTVVATTSKPTTAAPGVMDKVVPRKAEPKITKAPALDLSPVALLTPQILRQHMTTAEPKWQSCPKDGSGKNLSIGIVVAPSGSVVKADVMGPSGSTDTARCVTERIRNMRFPAYAEGGPKTFFWSYQVP